MEKINMNIENEDLLNIFNLELKSRSSNKDEETITITRKQLNEITFTKDELKDIKEYVTESKIKIITGLMYSSYINQGFNLIRKIDNDFDSDINNEFLVYYLGTSEFYDKTKTYIKEFDTIKEDFMKYAKYLKDIGIDIEDLCEATKDNLRIIHNMILDKLEVYSTEYRRSLDAHSTNKKLNWSILT